MGFANRELRAHVAPLLGVSADAYGSTRATYDLRRLRLRGLVERIPRSHRYRVTEAGQRVALCYSRGQRRVLGPALSALFDDAKPPQSAGSSSASTTTSTACGKANRSLHETRPQGPITHLTEAATSGKFPPMKAVRADIKRRVVIPGAKPGDIFDVQRQSDERFVLVRLHRANEAPEMSREACLEAMDRSPLNVALSWEQLRRITREP